MRLKDLKECVNCDQVIREVTKGDGRDDAWTEWVHLETGFAECPPLLRRATPKRE